jgi:hypothetical protein
MTDRVITRSETGLDKRRILASGRWQLGLARLSSGLDRGGEFAAGLIRRLDRKSNRRRTDFYRLKIYQAQVAVIGKRSPSRYLRQAIRLIVGLRQKDFPDWYRLGSIYQQLGDIRRARVCFSRILRGYTAVDLRAGALLHLAQMNLASGKCRAARRQLQDCLVIDPGHRLAGELLKEI